MSNYDYIIVGAGFAGSVCAERLANAGQRVLVLDKRDHLGGNAYDYVDEDGVRVHKYGPHIFHTNSAQVYSYLSKFTAWRPYVHRVLADVGDGLVPVPINQTTLQHFGGNLGAAFEVIVRPYTRKQWDCEPEELDPSVLARIQPRESTDDRYFTDRIQVMPLDGYTPMFGAMLNHPNITVRLGISWKLYLQMRGGKPCTVPVIWTGPIDEFFDYRFGRLPYRSAAFARVHDATRDRAQSVAVVNYPSENLPYTRVAEFKHLTGQSTLGTTLFFEYPSSEGEPFWPVPKAGNAALYRRYAELAKQERPDVHFVGRLGTYQYLNMDQCVAQALKLAATLLGRPA